MADTIRISVLIPSYQRRDLVLTTVRCLSRQEAGVNKINFEVIVVIDGSQDGSAEALHQLSVPFPLTILEQPNRGRAAALNHGAAAATGELLLFLDDDMEADPHLLIEHDRSHRAGADLVLGHIPLHPTSPPDFLSAAVGRWAEQRLRRLSSPGATLSLHDLITGQASVSLAIFRKLGGFDTHFNQNGSFGNEDLDFCHRLRAAGYVIQFNPKAISWQRYVITPRQHLRQWREAGRADVVFAQKHPDEARAIFASHRPGDLIDRLLHYPLWLLTLALIACKMQHPIIRRLFFRVRELEYWAGVKKAGGIP